MKKSRVFWFIAACLAFQSSTGYALNRCVQEDGVVTYSDKECVTVAPGSQAKRIHLVKKRSQADANSCVAVRELAEEVTKMMIKGMPSSDVYTSMGGIDYVDPASVNIVSYVYEYQNKISEINPVKMGSHAFARCRNGAFGEFEQASN